MDETIDKLQIEISGDASDASNGLEKLIGTLNSIKAAVAPACEGIRQLRDGISDLNKAVTGVNIEPMRDTLAKIAESAAGFSGIDISGISEIGNAFTALSGSFGGTDMNIGNQLLQFTQRLNAGMRELSGLHSNFDAAGLSTGISEIASAAQAISEDETTRLINLGSALSNLNHNFANMAGLSTSSAEKFSSAIAQIMDACRQINESDLARLSALQGALSELRQSGGIGGLIEKSSQGTGKGSRGGIAGIGTAFETAASSIQTTLRGIGGAVDWLRDRLSLSNTALGSFLSGLARIAKYRLLRTIIKGFTSGASEGLQNLAHASSEANAMLSRLSTTSLLLKNSMGGALYSALATAMNWITAVGNAAARAIDMLSQFFAILGGRTTYMKAVSATQEFVDTTNSATGSVKALKQELMGFDEINALTPDRAGGGGGGAAALPDYGAMFTEAPVSKWLQDMMAAGDFTEFGKTIAAKLNDAMAGINWSKIQTGAKKVVNSVTSAINGFFSEMNPAVWGSTIANAINTAAGFVSSFWTDTNWEKIGRKVKSSLLIALRDIDANTLANAIVGRIKAAFSFLTGLLPSSADEWREVTGKIASIIQKIITNIPTDFIGNTIGTVITGGLSMINSLAENMTLTNIADALKKTLESTFNSITPEQIEETLQHVKDDILKALETIMSIKINIGSFEFSAVGAVILASSVFNAIRGALSGIFSKTGFMSGQNGLIITGAVAFGLDALMKISDIKEAAENGSGMDIVSKVSNVASSALKSAGFILHAIGNPPAGMLAFGLSTVFELAGSVSDLYQNSKTGNSITAVQVAEIIGKALQNTGLMLLVAGHPAAGLITFGVGIAIEPVIKSITEARSEAPDVTNIQFIENWKAQLQTLIDSSANVSQVFEGFKEITGINISLAQFNELVGILSGNMIGLGNTSGPVGQASIALETFFMAYDQAHDKDETFAEFAKDYLYNLGIIIENTNTATASTDGMADGIQSAGESIGEFNNAAGQMPDVIQGSITALGTLNDFDSSKPVGEMDDLANAVAGATTEIKGTGTQAETTSEKISLIPTDVAVNLEITDYSTLISNLDTINMKFTTITDSVNELRLKISGDLMTSLNTLNSKISTTLKSTLDNLDAQFHTLRQSANNFQRTIDALHGTSINIWVYAGLTNGAKSFLRSLQNLDSNISGKVNNVLRYSQFASGGYPTMGQMFIANERGPELVGKIGNRTAVANEEQIGDAIFRYMDEYGEANGDGMNYDALASAMVSAMRAAGLGAVYLDGRMLAQSINRETARAGRPAITY